MGKSELEKVIGEYNKKNEGTIVPLSQGHASVIRFSTGSFSLDVAMGGGLPEGCVIEYYGEESTGKSLGALKSIKAVQENGKKAVYIDLEGSITLEWAVSVGINPDMLYIVRPKTAEQALQMVEDLTATGEVGLIVVDSVAALVPAVESENDIEKQQMGTAAKLMSKHLRRLTAILQPDNLKDKSAYNKTSIIYINQTREKIGVMFGSPKTTPGGKALKFYSAVRVEFRKGETYRDKLKNIVGQEIKFIIKKNKTYKPGQVGQFAFYYDGRIDNEASIVQYAIVYDLIKQGGAWFYFGDEKYQGKDNLISFLKTKPKVLKKLKEDILKVLHQ